ncbi:MAG: peptidylprolyl isomerase FKBP-type [Parcubacteria group bacterium]|nr:peptidylprolyl isomerase FKBP-type [Parcubacteria group bacterium]
MKNLTKNQWVAISVGLAVVVLLMFGGTLLSLFKSNDIIGQTPITETSMQKGVEISQEVVGTGAVAEVGDTVSVNYTGTLQNGTVFDSSYSRNEPIVFVLGTGRVIRGWDEGVLGMKVGGKRHLTISPEYGYGAQTVGPIPANSVLNFDVELVKVQKKS